MPKGNPQGYKKKRTYGGRDIGSGMASRARRANTRDQMRRDDALDMIMQQVRKQNAPRPSPPRRPKR